MSSVDNFGFDNRFFDKSLMQIRKNKGLKIKP